MIYIAGIKQNKQTDVQKAENSLHNLDVGEEIMFVAGTVPELRVFAFSLEQKISKSTEFLNKRYDHRINECELYYNITRIE